jgi:hypothetical protein
MHVPSQLKFPRYICFLHRGCQRSYGTFPNAGLISVRHEQLKMTTLLMPVYRREPGRIFKCRPLHILGSYFKTWFEVRAVGGTREEDISKKKWSSRMVQASY